MPSLLKDMPNSFLDKEGDAKPMAGDGWKAQCAKEIGGEGGGGGGSLQKGFRTAPIL